MHPFINEYLIKPLERNFDVAMGTSAGTAGVLLLGHTLLPLGLAAAWQGALFGLIAVKVADIVDVIFTKHKILEEHPVGKFAVCYLIGTTVALGITIGLSFAGLPSISLLGGAVLMFTTFAIAGALLAIKALKQRKAEANAASNPQS